MSRGLMRAGSACIVIAVAAGWLVAQTTRERTSLHDLALARVDAAAKVVDALQQSAAQGEPLTPTFLQMQSDWSRRLFEARLAAAADQGARIAAAQEYLDRSRHSLAIGMSDIGPLSASCAQYDIADAEYRVAELKSQ